MRNVILVRSNAHIAIRKFAIIAILDIISIIPFAILAMMDIECHLSDDKCYSCSSECKNCSAPSYCYSCNDGYYLSSHYCIVVLF